MVRTPRAVGSMIEGMIEWKRVGKDQDVGEVMDDKKREWGNKK